MQTYHIRDGAELAHQGRVYSGKETVELPLATVAEVCHLLCDAAGQPVPHPSAMDLELEANRPHAHEQILERHREAAVADVKVAEAAALADGDRVSAAQAVVADIDRRLKACRQPAPKPAPPVPAKPAAVKTGRAGRG